MFVSHARLDTSNFPTAVCNTMFSRIVIDPW